MSFRVYVSYSLDNITRIIGFLTCPHKAICWEEKSLSSCIWHQCNLGIVGPMGGYTNIIQSCLSDHINDNITLYLRFETPVENMWIYIWKDGDTTKPNTTLSTLAKVMAHQGFAWNLHCSFKSNAQDMLATISHRSVSNAHGNTKMLVKISRFDSVYV